MEPFSLPTHENLVARAALATLSGLYVSIFYIAENITMLPGGSIFVVILAFVIPIVVLVLCADWLCRIFVHSLNRGFVAAFICVAYLLFALRLPVFEIDGVRQFLQTAGSIGAPLAKIAYMIIPAFVLAVVFRNYVGKLSIVLLVVIGTAILQNSSVIYASLVTADVNFDADDSNALINAKLSSTPNIYFILADGFASPAYMDQSDIDISSFDAFLRDNRFTVYHDTFSNYQPTTSAMIAMLNMQHHYYSLTQKLSEVNSAGRKIIGGRNNLVSALRNNGYSTQYIHQGAYLLLHGCSADYCFPDVPLAGAKTILNRVLPSFLQSKNESWGHEQNAILPEVAKTVISLIENPDQSPQPRFQYIHYFLPGHTGTAVENNCDADVQLQWYAGEVHKSESILRNLIRGILNRDQSAVILLAGDHGPWIAEKCSRNADLQRIADYRDRAGALIAIRWPAAYDGAYDDQMMTTINMFRYLLASLADDDTDLLRSAASDDVYIRGSDKVLQVVENGQFLEPPKRFEKSKLMELHMNR